MHKMQPPRVPEQLVPVIKENDLRKLFDAVRGNDFEARHDKAIMSLLIDTGVRLSELAGLDVEDLDLAERIVVVLGKGRRSRQVRFVGETRNDLNRYLLGRHQHPHASDAAVWLGKKGRMTRAAASTRWCSGVALRRASSPSIPTCFATLSPTSISRRAAPRETSCA